MQLQNLPEAENLNEALITLVHNRVEKEFVKFKPWSNYLAEFCAKGVVDVSTVLGKLPTGLHAVTPTTAKNMFNLTKGVYEHLLEFMPKVVDFAQPTLHEMTAKLLGIFPRLFDETSFGRRLRPIFVREN